MYASRTTQFIVGIFALLGIAALVFLSLSLGRLELLPAAGYTLYANFDTIAGLKSGDLVEISGVKVGKVTEISLKDDRALVALRINQGVQIDDEANAAVKSSGIIGDKFVSIALGPGDKTLSNAGTIRHTQSAIVLEDLIGQLINNGGPSGGGSSGASGGSKVGTGDTPASPGCDKK